MSRLNYVRKVFAQTQGKTLENYVLTQIWAGVKHLNLIPVAQQYVKRQEGYALLDLYFPQIEIAVEVDEDYHKKTITHDKMRADDIFNAISVEPLRIIENLYETVEQGIQGAIAAITEKAKKLGPLVWDEDWQQKEHEEKFAEIKKRGFLDITDQIGFERVQVTNDIFGKEWSKGYLQRGKSFFDNIGSEWERLWFPHLTSNKKWKNNIDPTWTVIREKRLDGKERQKSLNYDPNILRYTFAKYKNAFGITSYRYIGNFRYTGKEIDTDGKEMFVYKRDDGNNYVPLMQT